MPLRREPRGIVDLECWFARKEVSLRCDLAIEGRVPKCRQEIRRTGPREALSCLRSRLADTDQQEGCEEEASVGDVGVISLYIVDD